jgi:hypothetical protein
MNTYDLYGVKNCSLTLARAQIEKLTGILLEERNSIYHGGVYYFYGDSTSEHFVLKSNVDPFDGEPVEQAFLDSPVLFYVNATNRSLDLMDSLKIDEGFSLLRHEVF